MDLSLLGVNSRSQNHILLGSGHSGPQQVHEQPEAAAAAPAGRGVWRREPEWRSGRRERPRRADGRFRPHYQELLSP